MLVVECLTIIGGHLKVIALAVRISVACIARLSIGAVAIVVRSTEIGIVTI